MNNRPGPFSGRSLVEKKQASAPKGSRKIQKNCLTQWGRIGRKDSKYEHGRRAAEAFDKVLELLELAKNSGKNA